MSLYPVHKGLLYYAMTPLHWIACAVLWLIARALQPVAKHL